MDRRATRWHIVPLVAALLVGGTVTSTAPGIARAAALIGPVAAPRTADTVKPSPTRLYACAKLISLAQLRKVTGLPDATSVPGSSAGLPKGETYCQFLAHRGALSIALTVWTGPSRASFDRLWAAGASAEKVAGIGDAARISVPNRAGAARVGGTGIAVVLAETGTKGLAGVNVRSAIRGILAVVAKRV